MHAELQRLPDNDLARQSQAGSVDAFEELVRRYNGRIYAFAVRCCGNPSDAGEVTQDTFVKAYQALAQFDSRREFRTWLFTIARRKCIDRRRVASPVYVELPELADPSSPLESLLREENEAEIWKLARRHLPASQFQALWLRYVEDMSVIEVARVLQKTKTHVKVLLFRARKALARRLATGAPHTIAGSADQPLAVGVPGSEPLL